MPPPVSENDWKVFHIKTIAKALGYDGFDSLRPQQVQSVEVDDIKRFKAGYDHDDLETVDVFFYELRQLLENLPDVPTGSIDTTALPEGPTGIIDDAIGEAKADVVEGEELLANISGSTTDVTDKGKRRKGKRKNAPGKPDMDTDA